MHRKVALAIVLASSLFPISGQDTATISANDVLSHLTRTVAWYHNVMALNEDSASTDNFVSRNNTREFAKRVLQSSFDFAHAQAAVLSNNPNATDSSASPSSIQQSLTKATDRVAHLEARLQSLDSRIAAASGQQREALTDERTAIAADLTLAKQVEAAVKTMASFTAPKSNGKHGLMDEINNLQALNPLNDAPADKDKNQTLQRTATDLTTSVRAENAGIVVLASKALSLRSARKRIDLLFDQTSELLESVDALRAPLRAKARAIVAESDAISNSEDSAKQPSEWLDTGKQIADLSNRFKQWSTVLIPLGETSMSLQSARGSLDNWRKEIDREYNSAARYLAIRLGLLLGGVLLILVASAVWQRAIFRYVTDPRRRRQLLLVKRVVVGLCLALLLTLGFLSSLGSVATLLGFVTAGLALALQNVILSAVAYFFLIGRYGLRVGDRITVQGVTGEVIEVGLIRLFLMELVGSGTEMHPTGRLAVFANSVIFQPSALMKQAPGLDYAWHAVTVTVEDPADYQQTRTRLTQVVSTVYEDYRPAIDNQHKAFEQTTHVPAATPAPVSRAQFSDTGLEVTIRYPVSLDEQPGHIDERVIDSLIAEADKEPKLKFTAGGAPKVSQVV